MISLRTPNRAVYRVSVLFGILAIAELIFLLLPKLRPLTELFDLIDLFVGTISPGLKGIVSNSPTAQTIITFAMIWLAAWIALEALSRSTDDLSLWHNISSDSCGTARPGARRFACTASKWMLTIATAPFLILWAFVQRLRHGHSIVTVGFVTIDPAIIIGYLRHISIGLALLLSIILFISAQFT